MPNPINTGGIVGIDNVSPIYNADRRWQIWNMDEIYLGAIASNKYVPKINDVVYEILGLTITKYIVQDIDLSTLIPVFREENTVNPTVTFTNEDILYGVGPGTQSDTYRVYLDKSVLPFRLSVDARLMVAGSMCRWAKIFKGSVLSNSGIVISRMYDATGNLLSENIPLELAYQSSGTLTDNKTIKSVVPCYTNVDMDDGELVTAVFYDDAGFVVSKRQLLVENTAFIRTVDVDTKYIIGISLKSPFINQNNSKLIQYPINVPLNGLNLMGVVSYSNGEVVEYPVDGTKFSIYGFDNYVATLPGQKIKVVLKYTLGPTEFNYVSMTGSEYHISETYEAYTLNIDGSYNVKLFVSPVWVSEVNGYTLEWFMYNLDRNIKYNVTPYVVINPAYGSFNPIGYGIVQRLNVSLNIKNANSAYKSYIHVQTLNIVLNKQGNDRIDNWSIGYTQDQNPRYGLGIYAKVLFVNTNQWLLKLDAGITDFNIWIERYYYRTLPLMNNHYDTTPPMPTHFNILINGIPIVYDITDWNKQLSCNGTFTNNSTLFIQFFARTSTNDLQLAVAGIPLYFIDNTGNYI